MNKSRGRKNIFWIEAYCIVPSGPDRGRRVKLTPVQREIVRKIYDTPDEPRPDIDDPLAAYLALLHVCGPEALQKEFKPDASTDLFTVWNATGPDLRAVLKRHGAYVVCPELGTQYPSAA